MRYYLDSRRFTDRENSHDYIKEQLGLPEYYGRNLDALYDCLTELEGEIVIYQTDNAGEYYSELREVFFDADGDSSILKVLEYSLSFDEEAAK